MRNKQDEHVKFSFTGTRTCKVRVKVTVGNRSTEMSIGGTHFRRLHPIVKELLHEKAREYMGRLQASMDRAWTPVRDQCIADSEARIKATGKNEVDMDLHTRWEDFC